MNAGVDLKYDYLRKLVQNSGVQANDSMGVFNAKMSRFRLPTIRWALTEMRAHSRREGAGMLVVLLPDVSYGNQIGESFLGIDEILRDLDVPFVPLIDAFDGVGDLAPYRVAESDRHPNAEGHKRLFERLYRRLESDPVLMAELIGVSNPVGLAPPRFR
jgi:hypothetical protein